MSERLKSLERKPWSPYQNDIDRLVKVSRDRDFELTEDDAYWIWQQHSDTFAAGWIRMGPAEELTGYGDGELWSIINRYMKEAKE